MLRALDLAEAIDAGDLRPSTVVEMAAEAIAEREGDIQAFEHLGLDLLRLGAPRTSPKDGLFGLPVALKDIIDTASMPTRYGSPIYAKAQPVADATVVRMILRASGMILGKTVTTELAYLNPPRTRNPHNPLHTPGGSSSGSAAAVASGMVPLALGTQTGGSVIRPAAFCGVAAIKPSFRLLPTVGVKPFAWTLDTLGVFGARVSDVAFGLSAITGRTLRVDGQDPGTPRFGVFRQSFAGSAAAEAEEALNIVIARLERAGATVVDVADTQPLAEGHAAHAIINDYEGALSLAWERETHPHLMSAILLEALGRGARHRVEAYDAARGAAKRARRASHALFEGPDVLISFSAPGAAPDKSSTGSAAFNRLSTLLGIPAVHVPVLKTSDNLPVGVQVFASFGRDAEALAAAHFLEKTLETHV
jgi:Asp-tRNA(Asn)/Glu-tRNA(Gln) amidotransferase A subunit family amidase